MNQQISKLTIDTRCPWIKIEETSVLPAWKIIDFSYEDDRQSGGNHNVYISTLTESGLPKSGVVVSLDWPRGDPREANHAQQSTSGGVTDFSLWASFNPSSQVGAYKTSILGIASDSVVGMGLPLNSHVNYRVTFQYKSNVAPMPIPVPTPQPAEGLSITFLGKTYSVKGNISITS